MPLITPNNFYVKTRADKLCTAFGVRLVTSPSIIQLVKLAGFDSVFIELEHSTLSIENASTLCTTALLARITPFVRVPYQCGNGFVQRILDGGAMGVIFPHIHNADDAWAAVRISKYPPQGIRSMTGQLPTFGLATYPPKMVIHESNTMASVVFLMIESADSVQNIDEIAAVPGVDVLLIGSNDLSIDMGVAGDFDSLAFRSALEKVSRAAKKHNKVLGIAGIYDRPDILDWVVNKLGARFVLGQQDSGILAKGAKACASALVEVQNVSNGHKTEL